MTCHCHCISSLLYVKVITAAKIKIKGETKFVFFYLVVPCDRDEQFQTMGLWAPDRGYKEIVALVFWLLLSTSR